MVFAGSLAACAAGDPGPGDPGGSSLADLMQPGDDAPAHDALAAHGLRISVARATGVLDLVAAAPGEVLVEDDATQPPERRARAFLSGYGGLVGLGRAERTSPPVEVRAVHTDALGVAVRLAQRHGGLPVLGGELIVRMNDRGITGVSGVWVPGIDVDLGPRVSSDAASRLAATAADKAARTDGMRARATELAILHTGLLRGVPGPVRLAWSVETANKHHRHQVWVDAETGRVLETYSLQHAARYRRVFTPEYDDANPLFQVASEEDEPNILDPDAVHNLYDFSGQVHDLFQSAFGRDSYDGAGVEMHTVYLVNDVCPNAYWDGSTTNYCPGFDLDDVVAHEWGHAYTQRTHGLIYSYQSGALNESYSDIWGEAVDLNNNADGLAGGLNEEPAPDGNRWQVGEDFGSGSGEYEFLLRDMCDPERLGYPGQVNSENYYCSSDDGGGVHYNSGVPNHAFALVVDGELCNQSGVALPDTDGIGFTKAIAIYYRAMVVYQGPTTNFEQHADALEASCSDLTGVDINPPVMTGGLAVPDGTITQADCDHLSAVLDRVGMRDAVPCNFSVQLDPDTPPTCTGGGVEFAEDFETGMNGWTLESDGLNPEWPDYQWVVCGASGDCPSNGPDTTPLPSARPGSAAFAFDSVAGTCAPGGDYSGVFSVTSPELTAPAAPSRAELRFTHYVESELGYDGGNALVSTDGGTTWTIVPQENYTFNAPRSQLEPPPPVGLNTNPKANEWAWHGANEGGSTGSWGTTVLDLTDLVQPGDAFQVRFEFGIDGCNGVTGWFVDDVTLYDCPPLEGPVLSVGDDYEGPDTDGSFTLEWERPAGAFGPDQLQQSTSSCAPAFLEDCQGSFAQWTRTNGLTTGWGASTEKPNHSSRVFRVVAAEQTSTEATMTTAAPIALPDADRVGLRWLEWYVNEPDDVGYVEVSTDGTTWTTVYEVNRALTADEASAAFATEPMFAREVDLTAYAGQSVSLRFRYALGSSNYFLYTPQGWWVDDIAIEVDDWVQISNQDVTATTLDGRADGTYCYRVRTRYAANGLNVRSEWSNVVTVEVERADGAPDTDGDGIVDPVDNCANVPNVTQTDADGDGIGDACDECAQGSTDGDTICDDFDNCPEDANEDQADEDADGAGDVCDSCAQGDNDADAVCDDSDNCAGIDNPEQEDADGDGTGDACDSCVQGDPDEDGVCDDLDNCPGLANEDQADTDDDGTGDVCDPDQCDDADGDRVCDALDNCPSAANEDQADEDGDGNGDACDDDNPVDDPFADDGGCGCRASGGNPLGSALLLLLAILGTGTRTRKRALVSRAGRPSSASRAG